MRVFTDEVLTIDYFSDQNYILIKRLGDVETDMEKYKYITRKWLDMIKKYTPEKQLVDYSELLNPIKPEYQKYAQENLIIPAIKISVKKAAFVIARNLFVQMSLEQTMSKSSDILQFRYFSDFNKAKNWLLQ